MNVLFCFFSECCLHFPVLTMLTITMLSQRIIIVCADFFLNRIFSSFHSSSILLIFLFKLRAWRDFDLHHFVSSMLPYPAVLTIPFWRYIFYDMMDPDRGYYLWACWIISGERIPSSAGRSIARKCWINAWRSSNFRCHGNEDRYVIILYYARKE